MGTKDLQNLTYEDMRPIALSFKKNPEELELYKWVVSHSNYSGFIKDILKDIRGNGTEVKSKAESKPIDNLIDF